MEIQVNINPDDINRQVSEMIVKSALGERLKDEIGKALNKIIGVGYYDDSVVRRTVEAEVASIVRDLVSQPQIHEQIKTIVSAYLAEKLTVDTVSKMLDKLWDKLIN